MPSYPTYKLAEIITDAIGGDWGKDPGFQDDSYELAYCIRGAEYKNWASEKGATAALRKIKSTNLLKRQLKEGDIIVEISGGGPEQPVGRTEVITKDVLDNFKGKKVICTNFLRLIRPNINVVDSVFLNHYLKFFYSTGEIIKYQAGSNNLRNLKFNDYLTLPIPLPPLPTQHQIVSRIESLFAELDKAVEHLRTAQQQLKIYRQAVLKSAFEECGEMKKVLELSSVVTSGSRGWAKYYTDKKDARFVRITDLTRDKITLQNNNIQYISLPQNVEGKRSLLQPNDVLVSITADLGSIAIVPSNIGEAYINQHIAMIRFKNSKQGKFMAYYLRSDYGQRSLLKNKRGGGKLGLGLDDIRNTYIPFVNDEEANEIVLKIETCLSQAEAAETRIAEALQKTEALRQSILKKAFSGELV